MPAPSKSFTVIPDADVTAGKPGKQALVTALRDNLVHLEEWLGLDYTAAQNHNHDGVNSALIEVGPNYKRNGSFESDLTGWTATAYTGGTVAAVSSDQGDGLKAVALTSTSTANGGGDVLGAEFIAVSGAVEYGFRWVSWAGAANISAKAEVVWYDSAQTQISSTTLWSTTANATAKTPHAAVATAPATARWARPKLTGGVPGSGSGTGTTYFDGFTMGLCFERIARPGSAIVAQSLGESTGSSATKVKEIQVPYAGVLTVDFTVAFDGGSGASARIRVNGTAVGTDRTTGGTYSEDITVAAGDLVQVYVTDNVLARVTNFKIKAAFHDGYILNVGGL